MNNRKKLLIPISKVIFCVFLIVTVFLARLSTYAPKPITFLFGFDVVGLKKPLVSSSISFFIYLKIPQAL